MMMSIKKIGNRIKEAREKANLTQQQLADELSVTVKTFGSWERGKKDIGASKYEKIMAICNGNLLPILDQTSQTHSSNQITLNYYPEVNVSAGYGTVNSTLTCIPTKLDRDFLENVLEIRNFRNLEIVNVVGDSMEPFVSNGEKIIVERRFEAKNGDVVIASINGEIYIKRFLCDPFKKWIKLISDNTTYPDILLEGKEIRELIVVGIVFTKITLFSDNSINLLD